MKRNRLRTELPADLRRQVGERVGELLERARARYPECVLPESIGIGYFDNRLAGGLAYTKRAVVEFNAVLLIENVAHYMSDIIPHEVAHVVAHAVYAQHRRIAPHGAEWQYVMHSVFGVEPNRTHGMNTRNVRSRGARKFEYTCACEGGAHVIRVSAAVHRRIESGASRCRCRVCRTHLKPLENAACAT
jgi:SprT protein